MDHLTADISLTRTNQKIFERWLHSPIKSKEMEVLRLIQDLFQLNNCTEEVYKNLQKYCNLLCVEIKKKWLKYHRDRNRFLLNEQKWLNTICFLPDYVTSLIKSHFDHENQPDSSRGRPQKEFKNCCSRTKKRKVEKLIADHSVDELYYAAALKSNSEVKVQSKCLTSIEAITLCLDLDLSERKYNILRNTINALHENCLPSIYSLRQAKQQFLPKSTSATVISAEVNPQEILNKTCESISKLMCLDKNTTAKLICKWRFDGSGSHSIYKQTFRDEGFENTDEYLFLIAFVPLKLVDIVSGENLWINERSSSSFYCRPIKFIFKKECRDIVLQEEAEMNKQFQNVKYIVTVGNFSLEVIFEMLLTMVDGSICNIISDTNATSKCYICGAKPTEMNLTNVCDKIPNEENYRFGLSSLHCWIRSFECFLHIAYRLPFKSWQAKGIEKRQLLEKEKSRIQAEFKNRLGLIVDKTKQGFGSSNDGNTARKFCLNSKLTAEITGLDEKIIRNFSLILRVIASGECVNIENFHKLITETKELYLKLYGWYYMPITVHKLLIHGVDIIHHFDQLPIGNLSEEALEALHKVFRSNRLNHTRKSSRLNTCTHLMNRMLLMSDPLISSKRHTTTRIKKIDEEMKKYLIISDVSLLNNNNSNQSNKIELDDSDTSE